MIGPTNIRALAKELNLSIGTVSKALRDSHEISIETKEKVFALAKKRSYTPNPYASSLRRKKSNTIGVVIPEVADSFFSHAIKGIELIAQSKGYHVLVYLTYESFQKEQAILKEFNSGRVDGVLMSLSSETTNNKHIRNLAEKDIPVVFFDRVSDDLSIDQVSTNDFESCFAATELLIKKDCRQLAYLSISRHLSINEKRIEGFKKALEVHGLDSLHNIINCSNDNARNYAIFHKMMKGRKRPDGIIASVEKLTTPIYLVCKHLNIHIPRALKLVGFSNLETASILNPSLTTVTQPAFQMGQKAAALLFHSLEKKRDKGTPESIIIPSELIERESTG
jgi:LacI family transcriptional regulator